MTKNSYLKSVIISSLQNQISLKDLKLLQKFKKDLQAMLKKLTFIKTLDKKVFHQLLLTFKRFTQQQSLAPTTASAKN